MVNLMKKQRDIFQETEANNYHIRNKKYSSSNKIGYDLKVIVETLTPFAERINNILELGCGDARKLKHLTDFFSADGFGVDLSDLAIKEAISNYPELKLYNKGVEERIFKRNQMDLIFLGFFLYVLDREDLYEVMSNVDYYLKDGGFLVIFDFDFGNNIKASYKHNENIKTYKSDYSNILLASGHYHLVRKDSYSHDADVFSIDPNNRISISILFKNQENYSIP
jgi:trans-aconitate methyltransferase